MIFFETSCHDEWPYLLFLLTVERITKSGGNVAFSSRKPAAHSPRLPCRSCIISLLG